MAYPACTRRASWVHTSDTPRGLPRIARRLAERRAALAERPAAPRTARFVCALAAVSREAGLCFETRGVVEGRIAEAPAGAGGFGYDPIFFYPPYGQTLAEVSDERKRAVAHRGQAFRAFADWLRQDARPGAWSPEPGTR